MNEATDPTMADYLADLPRLPELFRHGKDGVIGSVEHCALCGKKVNTATCYWVETAYGSEIIEPADGGPSHPHHSGAFPIGSDCAKKFPAGYLATKDGEVR